MSRLHASTNIVGSLRDREVACSAWDHRGPNFINPCAAKAVHIRFQANFSLIKISLIFTTYFVVDAQLFIWSWKLRSNEWKNTHTRFSSIFAQCFQVISGQTKIHRYKFCQTVKKLVSIRHKCNSTLYQNDRSRFTITVKQELYYLANGRTSKMHNEIPPNFRVVGRKWKYDSTKNCHTFF